jgi:hypothetical protein
MSKPDVDLRMHKLLAIAVRFRRVARETAQSDYAEIFLSAARELERAVEGISPLDDMPGLLPPLNAGMFRGQDETS